MTGGRANSFAFIQISDHHLGDSEGTLRKGFSPAAGFRAVLRDIADKWADKIDFIISTGDLVLGGLTREYAYVRRVLNINETAAPPGPLSISAEGLEAVPAYFLPGNHDAAAPFCRDLFGVPLRGEPLHLAFEHRGVRFLCPDWGSEEPGGRAPDTPLELAAWLVERLSDGVPTIVVMHYAPLLAPDLWDDDMIPVNISRFWEALQGKPNLLGVLFGHTHCAYETAVSGRPVWSVGATCYQQRLCSGRYLRALLPLEYRVVTVAEARLSSRLCEVELPLGYVYDRAGTTFR